MKTARWPGLFVTGTDTGVGKTVVSAALVSLFRDRGVDAVPMKPVQTGCVRRGGCWVAPDLEFCLRRAGVKVSDTERRWMAPYCFRTACSPHLAAAVARRRIKIKPILNAFRRLRRRHPFVVVEGAGGILTPLNEKETILDLMRALALPVVLVGRPGLGTLNHTLLSLHELDRSGLPVAGVIFNEADPVSWGEIEKDNIATVERLGHVRVLGRLPHIASLKPSALKTVVSRNLPGVSEWVR